MTEKMGRLFRAAPSLTPLPVSERTSLLRDVDGLYLVSQQDFTGLAEYTAEARSQQGHMIGTQRHVRHVAEIPNVIFYDLLSRFGRPKHNPAAWKRWLNDPENRAFRTWEGTV